MDLCRGAYDGRGNAVVKDAADIEAAVASLGGVKHGLYAERWAPFVKVSNPFSFVWSLLRVFPGLRWCRMPGHCAISGIAHNIVKGFCQSMPGLAH